MAEVLGGVFTVIVIALEVSGLLVAQLSDEVITQTTLSPSLGEASIKLSVFVAMLTPFKNHSVLE